MSHTYKLQRISNKITLNIDDGRDGWRDGDDDPLLLLLIVLVKQYIVLLLVFYLHLFLYCISYFSSRSFYFVPNNTLKQTKQQNYESALSYCVKQITYLSGTAYLVQSQARHERVKNTAYSGDQVHPGTSQSILESIQDQNNVAEFR